MFDWGVLKGSVLESLRFCFDDLPMYSFLVLTHSYLGTCYYVCFTYTQKSKKIDKHIKHRKIVILTKSLVLIGHFVVAMQKQFLFLL